MHECPTIWFAVEVPFSTKKVMSAPKIRAAWASAAPAGPEWSSSDPSSGTDTDRSDRNACSPKKSWNTRPTGLFRNATPPEWPGVCQEYSCSSENSASARKNGGSSPRS